jgi:hypothetical protein
MLNGGNGMGRRRFFLTADATRGSFEKLSQLHVYREKSTKSNTSIPLVVYSLHSTILTHSLVKGACCHVKQQQRRRQQQQQQQSHPQNRNTTCVTIHLLTSTTPPPPSKAEDHLLLAQWGNVVVNLHQRQLSFPPSTASNAFNDEDGTTPCQRPAPSNVMIDQLCIFVFPCFLDGFSNIITILHIENHNFPFLLLRFVFQSCS